MNKLIANDTHFKDIHDDEAYKKVGTIIENIKAAPILHVEDAKKLDRENNKKEQLL